MTDKYDYEDVDEGWFEEPLPKDVYCAECGEQCNVVLVDFGIGAYEYWGYKGHDVNKQAVTECCESDVWFETTHGLVAHWRMRLDKAETELEQTLEKLRHSRQFVKRLFILARKLIREAYQNGRDDQYSAEHTMGGGG